MTTARRIISGLFIGLTVGCLAIVIGGPFVAGIAPVPALLLGVGLWFGGSLLLALVKVIVF